MRIQILVMTLFCLTVWAADGEYDMQKALKDGNTKEADRIFNVWVNSGEAYKLKLAEKYLLYETGIYQVPPYPNKEQWVRELTTPGGKNQKQMAAAHLAPAAILWWSRNAERHPALKSAIAATAQTFRKSVVEKRRSDDSREVFAGSDKYYQIAEVNQDRDGKTTMDIQTWEELELAHALERAGALGDISQVKYAGTPVALDAPGKINADQLEPRKVFAWMLQERGEPMYASLMRLRSTLGEKTQPTREDVTAQILAVIESADPKKSEAMLRSVRNYMVKDIHDRFVTSGQPPRIKRTLYLSMRDASDLKLANALLSKGYLHDVQMVGHVDFQARELPRGKSDWNTNYPEFNWVQDRDGYRIEDILSPKSYRSVKDNALKRSPDTVPSGPLLREDIALTRSMSYAPWLAKPDPNRKCDFTPLAVPTATKQ